MNAIKVICQQKTNAIVKPTRRVAATSTKLEIVVETKFLALSVLILIVWTKWFFPCLSISVIYILIAVLKATFLRTTSRFYPISIKQSYLNKITNKLRNATTNSKIEMVWLSETIYSFCFAEVVKVIWVVTEINFVIITDKLGKTDPSNAAQIIPTM